MCNAHASIKIQLVPQLSPKYSSIVCKQHFKIEIKYKKNMYVCLCDKECQRSTVKNYVL